MTDARLGALIAEATVAPAPDARLRALVAEALVPKATAVGLSAVLAEVLAANLDQVRTVRITGGGALTVLGGGGAVDISLTGGGALTVAATTDGGAISVDVSLTGGGDVFVTTIRDTLAVDVVLTGGGALTLILVPTEYPAPPPPTPAAGSVRPSEAPIRRISHTYPALTLTNGIPQAGWRPE